MSYVSLTVVGNLGGDPEMNYAQNGDPVTNFSVAHNERYTNRATGEVVEKETQWFRVAAWGRLAEVANQYLRRGSKVMVVGPVEQREFTRQDGSFGASMEVRAMTIQFMDPPNNGNGYGNNDYGNGYQNAQPTQNQRQDDGPPASQSERRQF